MLDSHHWHKKTHDKLNNFNHHTLKRLISCEGHVCESSSINTENIRGTAETSHFFRVLYNIFVWLFVIFSAKYLMLLQVQFPEFCYLTVLSVISL